MQRLSLLFVIIQELPDIEYRIFRWHYVAFTILCKSLPLLVFRILENTKL